MRNDDVTFVGNRIYDLFHHFCCMLTTLPTVWVKRSTTARAHALLCFCCLTFILFITVVCVVYVLLSSVVINIVQLVHFPVCVFSLSLSLFHCLCPLCCCSTMYIITSLISALNGFVCLFFTLLPESSPSLPLSLYCKRCVESTEMVLKLKGWKKELQVKIVANKCEFVLRINIQAW